MKPKLTAWLLATLVVLASGWNVPFTTSHTTQRAHSIVWLAGVSERNIVPAPSRRWKSQRRASIFSIAEDRGRTLCGLNRTVFQLPPPAAFLQRV